MSPVHLTSGSLLPSFIDSDFVTGNDCKRRKTGQTKEMTIYRPNETPVSWPWQIRQSGKGSDVVIQVDSTKFPLHRVFLENGSAHFERLFDVAAAECIKMKESEGPMFIKLTGFPRGADTFGIAMDYCYGKVDHVICDSNVEDLIAANSFLQVGILSTKIYQFLQENVFVSPAKCLQFLSKLEDEYVKHELLSDCKAAFLTNIKAQCPFELCPETSSSENLFCNIIDLPQVVEILPLYMARDVYESIVNENLSWYFKANTTAKPFAIRLLTSVSLKMPKRHLKEPVCIMFEDYDPSMCGWLHTLSTVLPNVMQRALLLLYVARIVRIDSEAFVSINFLCSLLAEMSAMAEVLLADPTAYDFCEDRQIIENGLKEEIQILEKEVGTCLNYVSPKALTKCNFKTLLSSVIFSAPTQDLMKIPHANPLDSCLMQKLNSNALTVQQVLQIYEHFPNRNRDKAGHNSLYKVFEDYLRRKSLSAHERHLLSNMLDFDKLSVKIVERLLHSLDLGYEPSLLKRGMEILKQRCRNVSPKGKSSEDRERMLVNLQIIQTSFLVAKQNHVLMESVRKLCAHQGLSPPMFQDEETISEVRSIIDLVDLDDNESLVNVI